MMKWNVDLSGMIHLSRLSRGYFFTTFINNAIPFLFLPILTRYLSAAEFANVALFGLYLAICNSFAGVSIPTVISKNFFDRSKGHIAKIISASMLIVFSFSLMIMVLILLIYPWFGDWLNLSLWWLMLIPLVSFSSIVFNINLNLLRNEKKVLLFSYYQIGNTMMNGLISLVLVAIFFWGWQGRVWGITLSFFFSAIGSFYYLKNNGFLSTPISKGNIWSVLEVFIPLIPNSFQSVVIAQSALFFIQYYFTKKLLGIYSVGFQLAYAIRLLIDTLNLSWSPYLYQQLCKVDKMNKVYITRLLYGLFGIVFLGVIGINIFSNLILRIMTTSEYYGATQFIPWLTVGLFFQATYIFLMPILIKYDEQKFISLVSLINMFIVIGLNFGFIKLFGYIGVVYAYSLTYFFMFIALVWRSQKKLPLPWLKAAKIWR
jgi:O-antigen/teichoic acid export membrane protein